MSPFLRHLAAYFLFSLVRVGQKAASNQDYLPQEKRARSNGWARILDVIRLKHYSLRTEQADGNRKSDLRDHKPA
jgi:hypothetical protein